jgi:cytochrome c oxidase subunit I
MRRWLGLAIGALVIAGSFSLLVVIARLPPIARHITDATFFKRALVIHVDMSLVVWFTAFLAALAHTIPGRHRAGRLGAAIAAAGMLLMTVSLALRAEPVLANYIPVLDHPVYLVGLALVGVGVLVTLLGRRLVPAPGEHAEGHVVAVRGATVAFLLALVTLVASIAGTPAGMPTWSAYELRFWGAGHLLQVAHSAGMLAAWQLLLRGALGAPPLGRRTAAVLVGLLVAPTLAGPLLTAAGTTSLTYQIGFTRLMQFGIFAPVVAALVLCVRAVLRAPPARRRDARVLAFAASGALTLLGYVLGAMIRGSDTTVPAHYHAAIGAVTVAYMGVAFTLLERAGARIRHARLARWQPAVFGVGQTIFAAGFALAGAQGMARKTYGQEQHVRTIVETIGLGVMGFGGLIAIVGGVVFLVVAIAAWRSREEIHVGGTTAHLAAADGQPVAAPGPGGGHPDPVLHGLGLGGAGPDAAGDLALRRIG